MEKSRRTTSIEVEKVASIVNEIAGGMLRERGRELGIERCELGVFGHDGTMGGQRHWDGGTVDLAATFDLAKSVSAGIGRELGIEMVPIVSIRDDILIFGGEPGPGLLFDTVRL